MKSIIGLLACLFLCVLSSRASAQMSLSLTGSNSAEVVIFEFDASTISDFTLLEFQGLPAVVQGATWMAGSDQQDWVQWPGFSGIGFMSIYDLLPKGDKVWIAFTGSFLYNPTPTPFTYVGFQGLRVKCVGVVTTGSSTNFDPFGRPIPSWNVNDTGNVKGFIDYDTFLQPGLFGGFVAAARPGVHLPGGVGSYWFPFNSSAQVGGNLVIDLNVTGPHVGYIAVTTVSNDLNLAFLGTELHINDLNLIYAMTPDASGLILTQPIPGTLTALIGTPFYYQDFVIPFSTFAVESSGAYIGVFY